MGRPPAASPFNGCASEPLSNPEIAAPVANPRPDPRPGAPPPGAPAPLGALPTGPRRWPKEAAGAVLQLFPRLWAEFQRLSLWVWARTRRARNPDVALAAVKLFVPLGVLAAGAIVAAILLPLGAQLVTFSLGYFFVPFLGAFAGPSIAIEQGINPWILIAFVAFAALCGCAWLAFNFDWLLRVPWFGPWLARTEAKTALRLSRHKWLGRFEFWGIALFVALPIGGASGPVGVALGRLLGMNAFFTFLSVWLGSVIQVVGLVLAAQGVLDAFF